MKQLKLRDGSIVQFDGAHYAVVQGPTKTTLDGATWETTASAGELAVIRIQTSAVTAGS